MAFIYMMITDYSALGASSVVSAAGAAGASVAAALFLNDEYECFLSSCSLSHVFIVIYQFDKAHFSIITQTMTCFDDTSITTRTICYFYRDFFEQLRYSKLILQVAKYNTT